MHVAEAPLRMHLFNCGQIAVIAYALRSFREREFPCTHGFKLGISSKDVVQVVAPPYGHHAMTKCTSEDDKFRVRRDLAE
jgi:hypothetical protein